MAHWHDFNPWADRLVYVPSLEELAICAHSGVYSIKEYIEHWQSYGPKLDAYILPSARGTFDHSLGIRYGSNGEDYLSPFNYNEYKTQALLDKYGPKS